MTKIVVEEDAFLKCISPILDPDTSAEHRDAVADWFSPDEPDFSGWVQRVRNRMPGLFPATVVEAVDENDLLEKVADADAVIVERFKIGPREIRAAKQLKVVQKFGAIASNIDVVSCAAHGVSVQVHRRRINIAVAEHAFAMMIALSRRLPELNGLVDEDSLRKAGFDPRPFDTRYTGKSNYARISGLRPLYGCVLGALGLGEIGREVATRCAAFGMSILYHQRTRLAPLEEIAINATYVSMEELLRRSDFVSIHLPLTASTRGLLDSRALAQVKKGSILVNVARPEIVDRGALLESLDQGRIGGFGLDVGYEEPARPDEPLRNYKNVLLTPHTAPGTRKSGLNDVEDMCFKIWSALKARHPEIAGAPRML